MKDVEKKRQKEQRMVEEMIRLYCRKNHPAYISGKLCSECQELLDYARARSARCPFMKEKTFCVNCKVHCYKSAMRERIRTVMRFSGPRMLLYHPILAIWHLVSSKMIKTRLVRLLAHARKYIVYQILWQWAALWAQIVMIFTLTGTLDKILKNEWKWSEDFPRVLAIFLGVLALRILCDHGAAKASYLASADVKRVLRGKIYGKLLNLGVSYREQITTSEVVQLCTEGVEQLETYFGRYLPQLFYSLLAPLTLFFVLAFVNLKAALVLLICVPLIPISIVAVQKFAKKLLSKYWGIYTGLGDSFLENLQGLTTLKIYQADEKKAREMDEDPSGSVRSR